ncbi:hypothetical protein N9V16_02795 [SAR116 cluster bacterium]|nr:hypothetical protein [SAR116 cluster bacterium]
MMYIQITLLTILIIFGTWISIIIVKYGISNSSKSLIQGLIVGFCATLTAILYLLLRLENTEVTFIDKFWITIPFFASLFVSGRCIFGRIIRMSIMKIRSR